MEPDVVRASDRSRHVNELSRLISLYLLLGYVSLRGH